MFIGTAMHNMRMSCQHFGIEIVKLGKLFIKLKAFELYFFFEKRFIYNSTNTQVLCFLKRINVSDKIRCTKNNGIVKFQSHVLCFKFIHVIDIILKIL